MQLLSQSNDRIHRWDAKGTEINKPLYPWAAAEPAITYYLVDAESQRALVTAGDRGSRETFANEADAPERPFRVWLLGSPADEAHVADDLRLRLEDGQGVRVVDLREP
jgi:hypothetical protein